MGLALRSVLSARRRPGSNRAHRDEPELGRPAGRSSTRRWTAADLPVTGNEFAGLVVSGITGDQLVEAVDDDETIKQLLDLVWTE